MTIEPKHSKVNLLVKSLGVAGGIRFSYDGERVSFPLLIVTGINLPTTHRAMSRQLYGHLTTTDSFAVTVNHVQQQRMVFKIWRVDGVQTRPPESVSMNS